MYIHRGWAYVGCKAWTLALRDFEEATRLGPPDSDAFNGKAYARIKLGQVAEALTDADEALRLGPDAPEMIYNLACIFALAVHRADSPAATKEAERPAERNLLRAIELVRKALKAFPADRRESYWRENIVPDSDMDPIRHSPEFLQLTKEFPSRKQ